MPANIVIDDRFHEFDDYFVAFFIDLIDSIAPTD